MTSPYAHADFPAEVRPPPVSQVKVRITGGAGAVARGAGHRDAGEKDCQFEHSGIGRVGLKLWVVRGDP